MLTDRAHVLFVSESYKKVIYLKFNWFIKKKVDYLCSLPLSGFTCSHFGITLPSYMLG